MKRCIVLMSCAVLLAGCSVFQPKSVLVVPPWTPVVKTDAPELRDAGGVLIERVPFRAGISSVTVENMAKQHGCTGGPGAGLMSEPGPVEVYRMVCAERKVFMAKCELRQCKRM
jgi:hypothetical protein